MCETMRLTRRQVVLHSHLREAARTGDTGAVSRLLEEVADVNYEPKNMTESKSALMLAAESGHIDIVGILLDKGADPNAANGCPDGWTALMYAACRGHENVVSKLIEHKARVDFRAEGGKNALLIAAEDGHADIVTALLKAGADASAKHSVSNLSALMLAVMGGHAKAVTALIDGGADADAQVGECELVAMAAAPNVEWGLNKSWTALMCAADKGYNDVVLALIDKEANVNAEDEGGNWTPLMCAARGNKGDNKDVVLTLMREKANYNFRDKKMGLTALTHAAQAGYKETVLALIEKGADPFACDRGWECGFLGTALDEAAREGRADIVVALVDIMAKKLSVDVHGHSKVEDFLDAVSRELITSAEEARRFDTVAAIRNVVISLQRDMIGHRNMPPTISIADQAGVHLTTSQ